MKDAFHEHLEAMCAELSAIKSQLQEDLDLIREELKAAGYGDGKRPLWVDVHCLAEDKKYAVKALERYISTLQDTNEQNG